MSRIANYPVVLPEKVEVKLAHDEISVKGPLGELTQKLTSRVKVEKVDNRLEFKANDNSRQANAMSGTVRALVNNMVTGVAKGFEKKLSIVGVGFRAAVQGKKLNLTLGFSHPVVYSIPDGITIECPDQTSIVVKGSDRQAVGQVAAEIRAYRPPEPYKGKGVRYVDEQIVRKEAKKK